MKTFALLLGELRLRRLKILFIGLTWFALLIIKFLVE